MSRRINLALLLFAAACVTSVAIPTNRYGLRVVSDRDTYDRLARVDAGKRMVDLASIPGIRLDIRYATQDNFMKRALYPTPRAFLRAPAAEALRKIQEDLAK